MKTFANVLGVLILATGAAQAANFDAGDPERDMPAAPIVAAHPVQVKAVHVLSSTELTRAGFDADAELTVSGFSAPGRRSTFTR